MAQPALTGHARPPRSRPPKRILPHARAPPPKQRRGDPGRSTDHGLAAPFLWGEVQQMKRRIATVALVFVAFALIAQQALAQNEHFVRASGSLNNNGSLTVSFKEAGLGTNQLINYTLTAQATATYVCVNRGGANPSAQNKTTVAGPVSASGAFNSGKNGQVTASLTVSPPPSDISCPPGQSLELASVSYTNVVLTDTTNNVSVSLGDFSSGCLLPNVRGAC
jgi:hypothetical protein